MLAQPKLVLGDGPDEIPTVQPPGRVIVADSLCDGGGRRGVQTGRRVRNSIMLAACWGVIVLTHQSEV
jgi:hypothetical protein